MTTPFDWSTVSVEDQMKVLDLIGGDGHTVWNPDRLIEKGFPPAAARHFSRVIESDLDDPKQTIYAANGILARTYGMYGLNVLYSLAGYYGLHSSAMGRGFAASELTDLTRQHLLHL